jgi:hypothetical protein
MSRGRLTAFSFEHPLVSASQDGELMATQVAHYDVLFDGGFVIGPGEQSEKTLTWDMPNRFVHGTNRAKPMLAFMLAPLRGAARFDILVNHRKILAWGPIAPGSVYGLWAPFSAKTAFPDGTSFPSDAVPVRIFPNEGVMRFENVVMWSRVEVD